MSEQDRTLAISLSTHGFGFAIMEGNSKLIGYGNKVIKKNKNARVLAHVAKIVSLYQPTVVILHDVNAKDAHRHKRIKNLHRRVVALAVKRKIKVVKISGKELRNALLGNERGTKYEMAELLAKKFPDELALRLPPKRLFYDSEDARMDIFDAVGLVIVATSLKSSR